MALNLGSMFVRLGADTTGLQTGERQLKRFTGTAKKEIDATRQATLGLKKAFGGLVAILGIRKMAKMTDTYKSLSGRLKAATKDSGDFLAVQKEINRISDLTGSATGQNVGLFQGIARTKEDLGITNKEVLTLTESINKLGVIGGSTNVQMRDGVRQLTQGLAAGVVRAEEWNSVLENTPEIAFRIQEGLGKSSGEMRQMVIDGKLLSKDVMQTILEQTDEINKDFADAPRTIAQANQALQNTLTRTVGRMDEILGLSDAWVDTLDSVSGTLNSITDEDLARIWQLVQEAKAGFIGWALGIDASAKALDVLYGTQQDINKETSFLAKMWRQFVGMPNELKAAAEGVFLWLFRKSDEYFLFLEKLDNKWNILWENVRHWSANAAIWFRQKFVEAIAFVAEKLAQMFSSMAAGMDFLPFGVGTNAAKMLQERADQIDDWGKKNKQNSHDKMRLENLEHNETMKNFQKEAADIEKRSKLNTQKHDQALKDMQAEQFERDDNLRQNLINIEDEKNARIVAAKEAREAAQKALDLAVSEGGGGGGTQSAKGAAKAAKQAERLQKQIESRLRMVEEGLMTEIELEQKHYDESLKALDDAERLKIESIMPYHELRERLEEDHLDRMHELNREHSEDLKALRMAQAFFNLRFTEDVNKMTLDEHANAFRDTIELASAHSKEFFELSKAIAIAEALIDSKAAVVSAYKFGSAVGGPVTGAVFAGIAAAAQAAQVAGIASVQYRGGRATGGVVNAGGTYQINEQGPEIVTMDGKSFLSTGGSSGSVMPVKQSSGSSSPSINVVIEDHAGVDVQPQIDEEGRLRIFIEKAKKEIASDIDHNRGPVSRSIQGRYNVKRKGA